MSAVGLTKAMRMDMERLADISIRRFDKLFEAGMATICADDFKPRRNLTPRGHAALAAPRMTASQLALLEFLSTRSSARVTRAQWNVACNLKDRGFVVVSLCDDHAYAAITPSGLKALNNIRAAMGSELYKDNMP